MVTLYMWYCIDHRHIKQKNTHHIYALSLFLPSMIITHALFVQPFFPLMASVVRRQRARVPCAVVNYDPYTTDSGLHIVFITMPLSSPRSTTLCALALPDHVECPYMDTSHNNTRDHEYIMTTKAWQSSLKGFIFPPQPWMGNIPVQTQTVNTITNAHE